jgi:hypothetical protein
MPVILATSEAEIMTIKVCGQFRRIVLKTPSPKITRAKWAGGVAPSSRTPAFQVVKL